jgi:hypothetical protein
MFWGRIVTFNNKVILRMVTNSDGLQLKMKSEPQGWGAASTVPTPLVSFCGQENLNIDATGDQTRNTMNESPMPYHKAAKCSNI